MFPEQSRVGNINSAQHQPTHSAIYLTKKMVQLSSNLIFIIIHWLTLHKAQALSESLVSLLQMTIYSFLFLSLTCLQEF